MSLLSTSTFELEVTKNGKKHDFEVDYNPPSSIAGKSAFMKLKNVSVENTDGNYTNANTKPIPVLLSVKNLPQPLSTLSQTDALCRESRILGCFKTNLEEQPNVSIVVRKFPPGNVPANNSYTNIITGQLYGNETYVTGPFNSAVWNGSTTLVIYPGGYDPLTGYFPIQTDPRYIFHTNEGTIYGQSAMMYHSNKRKFVYARNWTDLSWNSPPMETYILGSNDNGGTYDVLGIGYGDDSLPGGWGIINANSTSTKKYNLFAAVVTKTRFFNGNYGESFHWAELEMYFEMEVPTLPTTIKKFPNVNLPISNYTTTKANGQLYGNEDYRAEINTRMWNGTLDAVDQNGYDPTTGYWLNQINPGPLWWFKFVTNQGIIWGASAEIQHTNTRKLKFTLMYTVKDANNPPMEFYILGSNDERRTHDVLGIGYGDETFPGGWNIIDCKSDNEYKLFTVVVTKTRIGFDNFHWAEIQMYFEDYVTQQYPPIGLLGFDTTVTTASYGNGNYKISASEGTTLSWQLFNNVWLQDTYFTSPGVTVWDQTTGDYTGPTTTLATDNNTYPGAWVQIQMPVPILLTTVTLCRLYSFAAPSRFIVLGSNDGTSWDILFHQLSVATYNPFNYFSVDPKSFNFYSYFRVVAYQIKNPHPTCNLGEILLYGTEMPNLHTESNRVLGSAPRLLTAIPNGQTTLQFSAEQLHPEQLEEAFTSNTRITAEIEFEIPHYK